VQRVIVSGLSKQFRLRKNDSGSFSHLLHAVTRHRPVQTDRFWALKDVSLAVEAGKCLGIIGSNGAGKSTLLKILNGTLQPSEGSVRVVGRKAALIELGAGFHPDFSGRDNVMMAGLILGMGRRDVLAHFDSIVEFSGIGDFIDVPVKYYSSGMYARLAFSVAVATRPEILLVDEILAVGDAFFRQRSLERIKNLRDAGASIVLVSHDLDQVASFCDSALWLNCGRVVRCGAAPLVVEEYRASAGGKAPDAI